VKSKNPAKSFFKISQTFDVGVGERWEGGGEQKMVKIYEWCCLGSLPATQQNIYSCNVASHVFLTRKVNFLYYNNWSLRNYNLCPILYMYEAQTILKTFTFLNVANNLPRSACL
jgi:hypothetical protein